MQFSSKYFVIKKETETQEHLESCEGNSYERRGLKHLADRDWKETFKFWERMCIKLERRKSEEETKKKKYKMKPVRSRRKTTTIVL